MNPNECYYNYGHGHLLELTGLIWFKWAYWAQKDSFDSRGLKKDHCAPGKS